MKQKKEPYSVVKTARITPTQNAKLEKLGISVREAIDFTIAKRENPIDKANERRREIEKEIKEHQKTIELLQTELEELMNETGIIIEINENENLDALLDAQKLKERYEQTKHLGGGKFKKSKDDTFANYINVGQGKRYLDYLCAENGAEDKEKYRNEILKNVNTLFENEK